jgi:hypothetical protein
VLIYLGKCAGFDVVCDKCDFSEHVDAEDVFDARHVARAMGWRIRVESNISPRIEGGNIYLCPSCREREESYPGKGDWHDGKEDEMRCLSYEPMKDQSCLMAVTHSCNNHNLCSLGWLTFWSDAERAGLKAMGLALRTFKPMSEYPTLEDSLRAHRGLIRAYVNAARKSKED